MVSLGGGNLGEENNDPVVPYLIAAGVPAPGCDQTKGLRALTRGPWSGSCRNAGGPVSDVR